PDDLEFVKKSMGDALNGAPYNLDFRIWHNDGSERWMQGCGEIGLDSEGNAARFFGTVQDITPRKQLEKELQQQNSRLDRLVQERTTELEKKSKNLEEMNIALNVLLQKRTEDNQRLQDLMVSNIKNLISPYVEKIRSNSANAKIYLLLDIIEKHLHEILSPLLTNMQQFNLTPKELQVATMVRDGKTTKEIAEVLGVETASIDTHRNNIRKKLGLNRKVNLQAKLQSLS
ncbi:MAG: LuxR C-terminal-related transcriptional regulator, partial [Syntrophales bacterium LBB04]|nr:LuxR C-terminal-related transcriptional regulator [Syntrophales bacterium LBB04]